MPTPSAQRWKGKAGPSRKEREGGRGEARPKGRRRRRRRRRKFLWVKEIWEGIVCRTFLPSSSSSFSYGVCIYGRNPDTRTKNLFFFHSIFLVWKYSFWSPFKGKGDQARGDILAASWPHAGPAPLLCYLSFLSFSFFTCAHIHKLVAPKGKAHKELARGRKAPRNVSIPRPAHHIKIYLFLSTKSFPIHNRWEPTTTTKGNE